MEFLKNGDDDDDDEDGGGGGGDDSEDVSSIDYYDDKVCYCESSGQDINC